MIALRILVPSSIPWKWNRPFSLPELLPQRAEVSGLRVLRLTECRAQLLPGWAIGHPGTLRAASKAEYSVREYSFIR